MSRRMSLCISSVRFQGAGDTAFRFEALQAGVVIDMRLRIAPGSVSEGFRIIVVASYVHADSTANTRRCRAFANLVSFLNLYLNLN